MANPQVEDGHTKIANAIMDALCKTRIPGEERQILDVVLRKTYGWNKTEDAISLSQFTESTGINKPCVVRAINGLLSKKIISVIKKDNAPAKVYRFNKNFDEWEPLSKKITLSKKIISVIKKDNPSLSKKIPTKDTTTKDTLTKEIPPISPKKHGGYSDDFLSFWSSYPKKSGSKKAAYSEWKKLNEDKPPLDTVLAAIKKQIEWRSRAGPTEFRPEWKDPERWIKNRMWESEVEITHRTKDELGYDL